jgi:hypothetical protein
MPGRRRSPLVRRFALAVIAATAAVGCGSSTQQAVDSVAETLQFQAPILGGGTLDGASLAGRPVLLWFWAPY